MVAWIVTSLFLSAVFCSVTTCIYAKRERKHESERESERETERLSAVEIIDNVVGYINETPGNTDTTPGETNV